MKDQQTHNYTIMISHPTKITDTTNFNQAPTWYFQGVCGLGTSISTND